MSEQQVLGVHHRWTIRMETEAVNREAAPKTLCRSRRSAMGTLVVSALLSVLLSIDSDITRHAQAMNVRYRIITDSRLVFDSWSGEICRIRGGSYVPIVRDPTYGAKKRDIAPAAMDTGMKMNTTQ